MRPLVQFTSRWRYTLIYLAIAAACLLLMAVTKGAL